MSKLIIGQNGPNFRFQNVDFKIKDLHVCLVSKIRVVDLYQKVLCLFGDEYEQNSYF